MLRTLFSLAAIVASSLPAFASSPAQPTVTFGGFGEYPTATTTPCLTDDERAEIQDGLATSIRRLGSAGLLEATSPQAVSFGWPVRAAAGLTDPGVSGISNFVDHDPAYPDHVQDYQCGTRTYDSSSGSNHKGTDIFNWPFAWYKMDHDQVEIVAAAAGTIVMKSDGNYDRNCSQGGGTWNAVYVRHADGSVAWYGHMKSGSLTSRSVGDHIQKGDYLGVVGSSGSSTGPHLHFEVYDSANQLIDPWAGPCNSSTIISWWDSQRPYYDSAVNALLTHRAAPVFPACPQQETPNDETYFMPGQTVYFAAYYRDQRSGQPSDYAIYDVANHLVTSWNHSSPAPFYAASYWYWSLALPTNRPRGWWRFQVTYQGVTTTRPFFVGDRTSAPIAAAAPGLRFAGATPNPARGGTRFEFETPAAARVRLVLLDGQGRRVGAVQDGWLDAGRHEARWDGRDEAGRAVAPGLYWATLTAGAETQVRKIVVTR